MERDARDARSRRGCTSVPESQPQHTSHVSFLHADLWRLGTSCVLIVDHDHDTPRGSERHATLHPLRKKTATARGPRAGGKSVCRHHLVLVGPLGYFKPALSTASQITQPRVRARKDLQQLSHPQARAPSLLSSDFSASMCHLTSRVARGPARLHLRCQWQSRERRWHLSDGLSPISNIQYSVFSPGIGTLQRRQSPTPSDGLTNGLRSYSNIVSCLGAPSCITVRAHAPV